MRTVSAKWRTTLATTHGIRTTVDSYVLVNGVPARKVRIPIISGEITFDSSAMSQRRVTLVVPLETPEARWDPSFDEDHPLAANGQRLDVRTGVLHPDDTTELLKQGQFQITSTTVDPDAKTITVQAVDLIERWVDCPILQGGPFDGFGTSWKYAEVANRLSYPALFFGPGYNQITPIDTSAMTNRNLEGPIEIVKAGGQDRMQPLEKLLKAWPAQAAIDDDGTLVFQPPITTAKTKPDLIITANDLDSTVLSATNRNASRRVYNAVYVNVVNPTNGAVTWRAEAKVTEGAQAVDGPMGYVPLFYNTPILMSQNQAQITANNLLRQSLMNGMVMEVITVPDASIQLFDTIEYFPRVVSGFKGLVTSIVMPLTAGQGPMQLGLTRAT